MKNLFSSFKLLFLAGLCININITLYAQDIEMIPKKSKPQPIKKKNSAKTIAKKIDFRKKYDEFSDFSDGLASVKKDGKWGVINKEGIEVIPIVYENQFALFFSEGLARVRKKGYYGYVNKVGEEIIPCIYEDANYDFSEGFANVKKDGKWGIVNKEGKELIPIIYDYAWPFSEGLASVKKDGKYGKKIGTLKKKGMSRYQGQKPTF
jgi:hypothetical protein